MKSCVGVVVAAEDAGCFFGCLPRCHAHVSWVHGESTSCVPFCFAGSVLQSHHEHTKSSTLTALILSTLTHRDPHFRRYWRDRRNMRGFQCSAKSRSLRRRSGTCDEASTAIPSVCLIICVSCGMAENLTSKKNINLM